MQNSDIKELLYQILNCINHSNTQWNIGTFDIDCLFPPCGFLKPFQLVVNIYVLSTFTFNIVAQGEVNGKKNQPCILAV